MARSLKFKPHIAPDRGVWRVSWRNAAWDVIPLLCVSPEQRRSRQAVAAHVFAAKLNADRSTNYKA